MSPILLLPNRNLMFKKLALTFFFVVGIFIFSLNSVSAQDMVPKPNTTPFPELRYPCGGTSKEADYHSLRPFQASPCGETNKAEYCSNELKFIESFDLTSYCTPQYQTGDFTCYPKFKVAEHDLYVSLDQSELPILGNTEDVTNSRTHDDIFDDARKVNEYVSWYLSGVNVRAEYGEVSSDKVVNYSGPLQKLLPGAIADAQRTKVIDTYGAHHNQIAVCATGGIHPLGKWLSDILGLPTFGVEKPIECYTSDESKAQDHAYRLSEWKGSSALQDIISKGSHLLPTIFPGNILADVMGSMGDRWTLRTPPLPWSDKNGVPFATSQDYQKAYNEWRGQLCAFLPNPFSGDKYLVCLGAWPIISNPYADLFQYIPLAETVDKEGAERIDGVTIAGDGGTVVEAKPETWPKITPPLYFAHTEEVKQLSEILNKTYIPKDLVSVPLPETTEKNECSVVNIRANPGDNLFPGDNDELQVQRVNYTITEVTCHEVYEVRYVEDENGRMRREIIHEFECPADVTIRIKTSTLTPNADEIFASTVADSTSTFRRIYPKVEAGAPVSCIADIPTVTNVTYDATKSEWPNGGTQTFGVDNYPEDGGNTTPQLTFPHIGSVYEYFLKGIQTALRPKGYADPNPISGMCAQISDSCTDWESELVENGGACGACNTGLGPLAEKILASAGTAYGVPASNIYAAMKHEGIDWPVFQGQFTDENVRKWSNTAVCGGEPMPSCDNNADVTQPPFGFLKMWFYKGSGTSAIWTAVQLIDPLRDTPEEVSRCNFLDAAYAAAKSLRQGSSMTVSGMSCGSYSFNGIQPSSCSAWTDAKVAQSQVAYSGQCANNPKYEIVPYKIEDVVAWEHAASCQ